MNTLTKLAAALGFSEIDDGTADANGNYFSGLPIVNLNLVKTVVDAIPNTSWITTNIKSNTDKITDVKSSTDTITNIPKTDWMTSYIKVKTDLISNLPLFSDITGWLTSNIKGATDLISSLPTWNVMLTNFKNVIVNDTALHSNILTMINTQVNNANLNEVIKTIMQGIADKLGIADADPDFKKNIMKLFIRLRFINSNVQTRVKLLKEGES